MPVMLGKRRARPVGWFIRVALYGVVLVGVLLTMRGVRDRMPRAFSSPPISVEALSVTYIPPYASAGSERTQVSGSSMRDVSVAVRIIGQDSLAADLRLSQFALEAGSERYHPFASDLLFINSGTLRVARGDTIVGVLIFTVPADVTPKELWWNP